MSILEDIQQKAQEFFGGSAEDITQGVEDATNNLGEMTDVSNITDQAQDFLSGGGEGGEGENNR